MISLEQLEDMFANIASGQKWDMTRPMLWGFFFKDKSPQKLRAAANELERNGYRFVDLIDASESKKEEACFFLHVERAEVHSPTSLHERNSQLYAFADLYGLESYDGMDVGPLTEPRSH